MEKSNCDFCGRRDLPSKKQFESTTNPDLHICAYCTTIAIQKFGKRGVTPLFDEKYPKSREIHKPITKGREDIEQCIAEGFGVDLQRVDWKKQAISEELLAHLFPQVCRHNNILPIAFDANMNTLTIASARPFNSTLAKWLAKYTEHDIRFRLADGKQLKTAIQKYFP